MAHSRRNFRGSLTGARHQISYLDTGRNGTTGSQRPLQQRTAGNTPHTSLVVGHRWDLSSAGRPTCGPRSDRDQGTTRLIRRVAGSRVIVLCARHLVLAFSVLGPWGPW